MKALVTGGAGFIGSHLGDSLQMDGIVTTVLDIAQPQDAWRLTGWKGAYVCGDVRDLGSLREAAKGCTTIFHLAGLLGTDALISTPHDAVTTNVLGTLNVLQVASEVDATVVHTSLIPDWSNSYMITKQAASKFCQMYSREFSARVIDLRLTHVYGPRQMWAPVRKVIPTFLRSALLNHPVEVYGSGMQLLDLLYVADAVRAIRAAAIETAAVGQSIEVGSGQAHTLLSLAELAITNLRSESPIVRLGRRSGEPEDLSEFRSADTRGQRALLKFRPEVRLASGLASTVLWLKTNIEREG